MSVNKKNQKIYWGVTFKLVWLGLCMLWKAGLFVLLWFAYDLLHSMFKVIVNGLNFIFDRFMFFVIHKRNQLNDCVMDYEFKMREIDELEGK